MNKNNRFLLPILCFAFFFFVGCERDDTAGKPDHSSAGGTTLSQQIQMPEFELQSCRGEMVQSESFDDKVLLIMFFSPICSECVGFLVEMEKLQDSFSAKEFSFAAIATGEFNTSLLSKLLEKHHLSFPVLLDPNGSLNKKFGKSALMPVTYLVTKKGAIVKQYLSHPDFESLKKDVREIL